MKLYQYCTRTKEDLIEVHDGFRIALVKLTGGKSGSSPLGRRFRYGDRDYKVVGVSANYGNSVQYSFEEIK